MSATELVHAGDVLGGRWTIERLLGAGGMATVYAATHRNGKHVAIKILRPHLSAHPEARARFLREGHAANRVQHPGAVSVDDDGETADGCPFLVMELLEGETLQDRRELLGALTPAETLQVVDELLDVLASAHDKGIVHRDLKPENIFLCRDGRVKVLDFGLARLAEGLDAGQGATKMGDIMGTPAYMAPEQARGRWDEVDGRTDLWAVGAVLFACLSGRTVHVAETVPEELGLAMTTRAPSLGAVIAAPAALVGLVDKALAYERAERWQSAMEMRDAVRALRAEASGPVRPRRAASAPEPPAPRTREARGATIAGSVLEASAPASRPSGTLAAAIGAGIGALGTVIALWLALHPGAASGPSASSAAPEALHEAPSAPAGPPPVAPVAPSAAPSDAPRGVSPDELPDAPAATATPAATVAATVAKKASAPAPPAIAKPASTQTPKAPPADPWAKRK